MQYIDPTPLHRLHPYLREQVTALEGLPDRYQVFFSGTALVLRDTQTGAGLSWYGQGTPAQRAKVAGSLFPEDVVELLSGVLGTVVYEMEDVILPPSVTGRQVGDYTEKERELLHTQF
jgi:hypothetical protein